ncbi:hypothetical protein FOZ63_003771, partial [Perkinsus olseni]
HPVCDQCLTCHIKVRIEEGDARLLVCPAEGCRVGIPDQVVKLLVDEHTAEQCDKVRAQNYVDVSKDVEEFEKAVKAQHTAEDQQSEGWVESHTTKCIDCSAPILRKMASSVAEDVGEKLSVAVAVDCFKPLRASFFLLRCGGEFCYMCGARWRPSHYTCMGAANGGNPNERRNSTSSVNGQQAVSKLLTSRLRADCIRGFTQADEDADEMISTERWGRLCQAVDVEPTLQALIEDTSDLAKSALGVLARSYVVLYFTPATPGSNLVSSHGERHDFNRIAYDFKSLGSPLGVRYMRAIRLLSSWTSSLERSLRLLISLLKVDYENYDDTSPERRREMLCIILAIRENKDLVLDLSCTVHCDVDRIIRAGRTGLLHQPGSVAGEIIGAFGSALQATAGENDNNFSRSNAFEKCSRCDRRRPAFAM